MKKQRTWFVTGISRGLGLAVAEAVLARGDAVVGTTRDGKSDLAHERLRVVPLELADATSVARAVAAAGAPDVVVNNAGYGLLGAIEDATEEELAHVFEVNFFSALRLVRGFLPAMRARRSGHIVNVTSIAGIAPLGGSGLYAAAKAALDAASASLAQELAPLGIGVTIVAPGAFRTDFLSTHSIRKSRSSSDDYAASAGKNVAYLDGIAGTQLGDPARGAQVILEAVVAEKPPLHLVLGADAVRRTRERLASLGADVDAWEMRSSATGFAK